MPLTFFCSAFYFMQGQKQQNLVQFFATCNGSRTFLTSIESIFFVNSVPARNVLRI